MPGFDILLFFNFVGYLLCEVARVPLVPNVVGLIGLLLALQSGLVKLRWVEEIAGGC